MFWLLAIVFWFSLLFGTYVTGNGIGNWIALVALVLMIRARLRAGRAAAAPEATTDNRAHAGPVHAEGRPHASSAPTATGISGNRATSAPTRRWR
jgi:hypothetical protein